MAPQTRATPAKRKQDDHINDDINPKDEAQSDGSEPPIKAGKGTSDLTPTIEWLLSDEAFDMANPEVPTGHGEIDWLESERKKPKPDASAGKPATEGQMKDAPILRYPHSSLTPFQNLIAACLLSKPINHKLGLRTIQTLLNPPFGLRTLKDLDEAGFEGRRKVMWEARTQHKEKTASQLGDLVTGIRELCGEKSDEIQLDDLEAVRGIAKKAQNATQAAEMVTSKLTEIKGVGPGVAAIFLRRVQRDWEEVFPYADERGLETARLFGLTDHKGGAIDLAEAVQ